MTYKVEMVDSLPQPIEPKWLRLRCKLEDMKVCLKPLKLTVEKWSDLEKARSTVHAWAKANDLRGQVHTMVGDEENTLYVYIA